MGELDAFLYSGLEVTVVWSGEGEGRGLVSSQAMHLKAACSLLPLNLSACLIGQPRFHSTYFPLRLQIVSFSVGRMEHEEY